MDKDSSTFDLVPLLAVRRELFLKRVQPLLDEYVLCSLKIRQLGWGMKDENEAEVQRLKRIMSEDEKRIIELLHKVSNPLENI